MRRLLRAAESRQNRLCRALTRQGMVRQWQVLPQEAEEEGEIEEDFQILAEGFRLLSYDYLGGNGSRGYGKVLFHDMKADVVIGAVDAGIISRCNALLEQVMG